MKKGNILIITGLICIVSALCITGYNLIDDYRAGSASEYAWKQLISGMNGEPIPLGGKLHSGDPNEIEYPDYLLNPEMDMPVKMVNGKAYVGVLSISALNKNLPVLNEWSYKSLKTAPCRYSGTAYLGNMIICAHNFQRHFGYIKNLKYGDSITFTDMDGNVFNYIVVEVENLKPTAVEEMEAGDWDLTLFTCTIGGRSRICVRCESYKGDSAF